MNINFIAMGKLKESWYREACAEYMKRLGAYVSPKVIEPSPVDLPQKPSQAQIDAALRQEAAKIREQIKPGSFTVAMCIEGKTISSEQLAQKLETAVQYGELPCGELLRAGRGTEKAGRPAAFHVADDLPAFPGAGNAYGTSLPRLFNTEQRKISQIRSILWISH